MLQPYLVKHAIDTDIVGRNLAGLGRTGILLVLVTLAAWGFQVVSGYGIQYLGQRLLMDLRMDLFRKVLGLSNDYFDRTPVGKTLTNLSNDLEALREFIAEGIVSTAGDLLKVALILVAMLLINFKLALVAFVTIPLFVTAALLFRARIRSGFREVRKANGEINVALSETISGIREIHQFGYERQSRKSFARNNTQLSRGVPEGGQRVRAVLPGNRDRHEREHDPDSPRRALLGGHGAADRRDLRLLRLHQHVLLSPAAARGKVQPPAVSPGGDGEDIRPCR